MSTGLHNPRPYLFLEDDTDQCHIGEIDGEDLAFGAPFSESEVLQKLDGEQKADYKQARSEGFHPVLLIDIETGVIVLEMRKHNSGPGHPRDGV